jgi:endonuclease/exonuclease/phosphatase family metal-dependent hydrolase
MEVGMQYLWKRIGVIFLPLGLMVMGGCNFPDGTAAPGAGSAEGKTAEILRIMTWNVQALFDGEETGNEYEEYLDSAGWSPEKYRSRLNVMAQAIEAMEGGAPDVLALEEVENAGILEDLTAGPLSKQGYQRAFFVNNNGAALGIGVLSRFPLINTRAHSLSSNGETVPRPVMEVWIEKEGEPLALFICHWKSKLGGDDATELLRRASARVILRRIREIQNESPGTPVAVMGDLNENYDEFYRRNGAIISALLPDDPQAGRLAGFFGSGEEAGGVPAEGVEKLQRDFLVISKFKPPAARYFPAGTTVLYSPWGQELEDGSYYYQNKWETIDHFLLSGSFFDGSGWEFDSAGVVKGSFFTNAGGFPYAYNPRTGSGVSDHLPLILVLKRAKKE